MEGFVDESLSLDLEIIEGLSWSPLPESPLDEERHLKDENWSITGNGDALRDFIVHSLFKYTNDNDLVYSSENFTTSTNSKSNTNALGDSKPNTHDGPNGNICVSPNCNKFDKSESIYFRKMPSDLNDLIFEISTRTNSPQTTVLYSAENVRATGRVSYDNTLDTDQLKVYGSLIGEDLLSALKSECSDIACFKTMSQDISDFILESSGNNDNKQDVNTTICQGAMKLLNTGSKILPPDIKLNVSADNINCISSSGEEMFHDDFTRVHGTIDYLPFYEGTATPRYDDRTEKFPSCKENGYTDNVTSPDLPRLNGLSINEAERSHGQGSIRNNSVTKNYKPGLKKRGQSKRRFHQREHGAAWNRSVGSNQHDRSRADPYLRAYREHINYRQRLRVAKLNQGYKSLHAALPCNVAKQKLSKLEILAQAVHYIKLLDDILNSSKAVDNKV